MANRRKVTGYLSGSGLTIFPWELLLEATDNFSPSRKIGRGGFGDVFSGTARLPHKTIVPSTPPVRAHHLRQPLPRCGCPEQLRLGSGPQVSGMPVAIKRLRLEGQNGETAASSQGSAEFLQEIAISVQFQHPNILPLLGVAIDKRERCLVTPLMSGGNLEQRLARPARPAAPPTAAQPSLAAAGSSGTAPRFMQPGCGRQQQPAAAQLTDTRPGGAGATQPTCR